MLFADVIVPFTIDQAYVAAPAGPFAVFPVELAQSDAGVGVIVDVGVGLTVTFTEFEAAQPVPSVTVSCSVTGSVAPASHVMFWMFVADVMVPLVIDHA